MYKCMECGNIFDRGEEKHYTESHGEQFAPAEHWDGCQLCAGAFEETVRCDDCGAEHLPDELYAGKWCESCLMEKATKEALIRFALGSESDKEDFAEWLAEGGGD